MSDLYKKFNVCEACGTPAPTWVRNVENMSVSDPICSYRFLNGMACVLLAGHKSEHEWRHAEFVLVRTFTQSEVDKLVAEGQVLAYEAAASVTVLNETHGGRLSMAPWWQEAIRSLISNSPALLAAKEKLVAADIEATYIRCASLAKDKGQEVLADQFAQWADEMRGSSSPLSSPLQMCLHAQSKRTEERVREELSHMPQTAELLAARERLVAGAVQEAENKCAEWLELRLSIAIANVYRRERNIPSPQPIQER